MQTMTVCLSVNRVNGYGTDALQPGCWWLRRRRERPQRLDAAWLTTPVNAGLAVS
jgi:hypothetical protein